jgi:hypothetical protein
MDTAAHGDVGSEEKIAFHRPKIGKSTDAGNSPYQTPNRGGSNEKDKDCGGADVRHLAGRD